jgi:hypothetical protein
MILKVHKVGYLCFAAVLDAFIKVQQLCLHSFDHRFDFRSTWQLLVGLVQFGFWTLTYKSVVGKAHGGVRNLQPVHGVGAKVLLRACFSMGRRLRGLQANCLDMTVLLLL